jgi:ribosomal protein S2
MKIHKQQIGINILTEAFLSVGKPGIERNQENLDNVMTTPSKYDQIDLSKSYRALRKSLLTTSNTVAKGGKVLVFHKLGNSVDGQKKLKLFFTKDWTPGLISNFKTLGKQSRHIPNFVVVSTNDNIQQSAIAGELNRCKVNSTFITSSNNPKHGLISVAGNNSTDRAANLVVDLFKRAITIGFLKEVATLQFKRLTEKPTKRIKKPSWKNKFPRLGSNQRPRT